MFGKGMTGWLSPDGVFYECSYGEHYKFAQELMSTNPELDSERIRIGHEQGTVIHGEIALRELEWIPMGVPSNGRGGVDYIHIPLEGRTEEQIEWFEENYYHLSELQQSILQNHIARLAKRRMR